MTSLLFVKIKMTSQPQFVHPFIEYVKQRRTDEEIINLMNTYMGCEPKNDNSQPIYNCVDLMEFMAPVLHVMFYAVTNNRISIVEWLVNNYIPLQASYDDNIFYFEASNNNRMEIINLLVHHPSFIPDFKVLEDLKTKGKYDLFADCMKSPNLDDLVRLYALTFRHYIDLNMTSHVDTLLSRLKCKQDDDTYIIPDTIIYPHNEGDIPHNEEDIPHSHQASGERGDEYGEHKDVHGKQENENDEQGEPEMFQTKLPAESHQFEYHDSGDDDDFSPNNKANE